MVKIDSKSMQTARECLVCHERIEGEALDRAEKLRYFDDLCLCSKCLEAERKGAHGKR